MKVGPGHLVSGKTMVSDLKEKIETLIQEVRELRNTMSHLEPQTSYSANTKSDPFLLGTRRNTLRGEIIGELSKRVTSLIWIKTIVPLIWSDVREVASGTTAQVKKLLLNTVSVWKGLAFDGPPGKETKKRTKTLGEEPPKWPRGRP